MGGVLRNRMLRASDSLIVADWLIANHAPSGFAPERQALARRIADAVNGECMKGTVVEYYDVAKCSWQTTAIGISCFVATALIDQHLRDPQPFLMSRLIHQSDAGPSILMGPDEIARGNGGDGLDLVLQYVQTDYDLANTHVRCTVAMAFQAYVRHHRGYRIRRVLQEDWERQYDIYQSSGYRRLRAFEVPSATACAGDASRKPTRVLYYADRQEDLQIAPGSPVSYILQYEPPACGLTRAEQRVLTQAIEGMTDDEIASGLNLSHNTLKQIWRSVYERVERKAPQVLCRTSGHSADGRRGPEKRRYVLTFLSDHPQELRPH